MFNMPAVQGRTEAPLGLMGRRIIHKPWKVVAADITGTFFRSKAGFEYILVFQDLFTRWVECIPIRKADKKTIRKELKNRIVLRYNSIQMRRHMRISHEF